MSGAERLANLRSKTIEGAFWNVGLALFNKVFTLVGQAVGELNRQLNREGKTLTNANLALALAATGKKVLLVDADLRKPSVHKLFGLTVTKEQGLPMLLSWQSDDLNAHLFPGPVPGLWLLPCGVVAPNPSELLGSEALARALMVMKKRFDHVVFDVSPILPVTDGVVLARRLDGVAVLARFEQTRRVELTRALEYLEAVHAPVLGTILNAVDMRKYSYAYGYGSKYYSYHGKGD